MASRISRELALLLTGKDVSWSKATRKAAGDLDRLGGHVGKGTKAMSRNLQTAGTVAGVAFAGALAYSVRTAIDKESAIAGVAKTIEGDVAGIVKGLENLSTAGPTSFNELAAIAEQAGALGIAKDDIVAFTDVAAKLGATTNVSALDAATALGQLGNVMGLQQEDFERFGSALVDLGNKGASTEAQILEIERRAGGAGHLLEIATDKTLGWAAAAANLGMNNELAGTALDKFFTKSLTLVAEGGEGLTKMGDVAGMTAKQFSKAFEKDASGALETFIKGLGKLPKDKRIKAIQTLFGKQSGLGRLLVNLAGSYETNLAPSIDTATQAWDENLAMNEEAAKRYGTTASVIATLRNNVDLAASTIGGELLPVLADLSKQGIAWLQDNQGAIADFAVDLADGFKTAVAWAQKLDWDKIGSTMKGVAGAVGAIVSGFAGLPDWLKTAVITGWGLNKFTGGALGDIGGDIGKIAFDMFAGRGSSPMNPLYVSGAGVGGPGGPGGGSSPLALIAPALVAGAIIAAAVPIGEAFADALPDSWKGPDGQGKSESQTRREQADAAMGRTPAEPRTGGMSPDERQEFNDISRAQDRFTDKQEANRLAVVMAGTQTGAALGALSTNLGGKVGAVTAATRGVTGAIRAKDLSVSVTIPITTNVRTTISARALQDQVTSNAIRTHGVEVR